MLPFQSCFLLSYLVLSVCYLFYHFFLYDFITCPGLYKSSTLTCKPDQDLNNDILCSYISYSELEFCPKGMYNQCCLNKVYCYRKICQ